MSRKELLLALGGASALGSTVVGSEAFSSVAAERTVDVSVVGDASAYLALEPATGPNGAYATVDDGELALDLSPSNDAVAGEGVNDDAVTVVQRAFRATNQGTQPVVLWITHDSEHVEFHADGGPVESEGDAVRLPTGGSAAVGFTIDTRDTPEDGPLVESFTVHALAAARAETGAGDGGGDGGTTPSFDATRRLSTTAPDPGERLRVTTRVTLGERQPVDVFERLPAGLGEPTLTDATVDGLSVTPAVADVAPGGALVLFDGIGPGTLALRYEVAVTDDEGTYTLAPTVVDSEADTVRTGAADVTVGGE
ncbi:DUF1102 domain-containing protein [Haloarcula litorea]|uniref:DUF1102 domain-containing protein n=1 Tax=Haloarcula litorea TaxID=3032579 RepID=UPI0023E8C795|nr:DUF1102 domain-containing protein [Halomicroarcula sp. GDY20]